MVPSKIFKEYNSSSSAPAINTTPNLIDFDDCTDDTKIFGLTFVPQDTTPKISNYDNFVVHSYENNDSNDDTDSFDNSEIKIEVKLDR